MRQLRGERYFLVPNKKVTKEVGLGETLTVKPIGTSSVSSPIYPDFKPLSPKSPSRPPSLPGLWSIYAFYRRRDIWGMLWGAGWSVC